MSKITISYDSENKTAEVAIDGAKVENVRYVSLYLDKYEGKEYGEISIETHKVEDNGVKTYTRLCASKKDEKPSDKQAFGLNIEKIIEKHTK